MSIVTNIPFNFSISVVCNTSAIKRPPYFDNLQKLVSVGAIRRFMLGFFANQNFSRDRKTVLLRKWIALMFHMKFHFMLPSKIKRPNNRKQIASSLSSQLIVLLFLRNSNLQRGI